MLFPFGVLDASSVHICVKVQLVLKVKLAVRFNWLPPVTTSYLDEVLRRHLTSAKWLAMSSHLPKSIFGYLLSTLASSRLSTWNLKDKALRAEIDLPAMVYAMKQIY